MILASVVAAAIRRVVARRRDPDETLDDEPLVPANRSATDPQPGTADLALAAGRTGLASHPNQTPPLRVARNRPAEGTRTRPVRRVAPARTHRASADAASEDLQSSLTAAQGRRRGPAPGLRPDRGPCDVRSVGNQWQASAARQRQASAARPAVADAAAREGKRTKSAARDVTTLNMPEHARPPRWRSRRPIMEPIRRAPVRTACPLDETLTGARSLLAAAFSAVASPHPKPE